MPAKDRSEVFEEKRLELSSVVELEEFQGWHLFQWIDAQDPADKKWYEAQIVQFDAGNRTMKIHFRGYHQKFDLWIPVDSEYAHPLHSHTVQFARVRSLETPGLGVWIDVQDPGSNWCPAQVVQIDPVHKYVKVHYYNWSDQYDEWINGNSYRIAPLHRFTEAKSLNGLFQRGEDTRFEIESHLERQKCVATPRATLNYKASIQNEERFRELLRRKMRAVIVDMENDGNCLFRSISHQVYGDPSFHSIVRAKCVEYLVRLS
jgi:hypothetical protein